MKSVDADITRIATSEQISATSSVFQTDAVAGEALGSSTSSLEQILEAVVKVMDSISEVIVHCRVECP